MPFLFLQFLYLRPGTTGSRTKSNTRNRPGWKGPRRPAGNRRQQTTRRLQSHGKQSILFLSFQAVLPLQFLPLTSRGSLVCPRFLRCRNLFLRIRAVRCNTFSCFCRFRSRFRSSFNVDLFLRSRLPSFREGRSSHHGRRIMPYGTNWSLRQIHRLNRLRQQRNRIFTDLNDSVQRLRQLRRRRLRLRNGSRTMQDKQQGQSRSGGKRNPPIPTYPRPRSRPLNGNATHQRREFRPAKESIIHGRIRFKPVPKPGEGLLLLGGIPVGKKPGAESFDRLLRLRIPADNIFGFSHTLI